MKMEEYSETSAYKIQPPGNYPEESIQQIWTRLQVLATRSRLITIHIYITRSLFMIYLMSLLVAHTVER